MTTDTVSAEQVIADWRASRAPRDPYDDLGVLAHEVERLQYLVEDWKRRYSATLDRWSEEASAYREVANERDRLSDGLWQILADLGNALNSDADHRVRVALLHTREALDLLTDEDAENANFSEADNA